MDLLYTMIIFPLEFIIEWTLEWAFSISDSYGFSLVVVSALVSIGGLPLYHVAEKWQDAERAIQKKMKHKIDEFKSVLKGYELHACLNTLYRQNGYHPIYAVRTSFGILIQIPFFFAAYHLLSNYEVLNGVSFLLIDDLGSPDQMLSTPFGFINVLPFLMTIINIGSSFIYGKKGGFRENVQLYGLAVFFLVFLYNSPSGLLFYWTLNNLFGLVKNVGYYVVGKPTVSLKKNLGEWFENNRLLKIVNGTFERGYNKHPSVWIQCLMLLIAWVGYTIMGNKGAQKIGLDTSFFYLFSIPMFVIALFQVLSMFKIEKQVLVLRFVRLMLTICLLYAFGLLVYTMFLDGVTLKQYQEIFVQTIGFTFVATLLVRSLSVVPKVFVERDQSGNAEVLKLFWLGVLSVSFLILVSAPMGLLASGSLADFSRPLMYYLHPLIGTVSLIMLGTSLVSIVFGYSVLKWIGFWSGAIALLIVVNQFLFVGAYGDMSNFVFQNGLKFHPIDFILNVAVLLFVFLIYCAFLMKAKVKWINTVLLVVLIASVGVSVFDASVFNQKRYDLVHEEKKELDALISLSSNNKNVVILMMDRMIGGHIPQALEWFPELRKQFSGFKWYPKSLTEGSFTISGVPALTGGYDYTIDSINTQRTNVPLKNKLDEAFRVLPYNFKKAGFKASLMQPSTMIFNKKNKEHLKNVRIEYPTSKYNTIWSKEHGQYLPKENEHNKLIMFGLFRASPLLLRNQIYNKGKWNALEDVALSKKKTGDKNEVTFNPTNSQIKATLGNYAVIDYLSRLTRVTEDSIGQYVFLANDLVHEPWSINEDLTLDMSGSITYPLEMMDAYGNDLHSLKHVYATATALKLINNWITYLKEKGIYDNTRLIIVSDHGRGVYNPMFNAQKIPVTKGVKRSNSSYLKTYDLPWFHNTLLVKDFNASGDLEVDSTFMTVADVPWLALDGIIKGVNPYTGNPIQSIKPKLPFTVKYHDWRLDSHSKHRFKVEQSFTLLNEGMFDVFNWGIGEKNKIADTINPVSRTKVRAAINKEVLSISKKVPFSFHLLCDEKCSASVTAEEFYGDKKKEIIIEGDRAMQFKSSANEFYDGYNTVIITVYSKSNVEIHKRKFHVFNATNRKHVMPKYNSYVGKQGWGSLGRNQDVTGKKLQIDSVEYNWGLGTHTNSSYSIPLNKKYKEFKVAYGLSSYLSCGDGARFEISINDSLVLIDTLKASSSLQKMAFNVSEADSLTIATDKLKNGQCDHTNWINPILIRR